MKKFLLTLVSIVCAAACLQAEDATPFYTLQFGADYNDNDNVQDYTTTWTATCDGITWTVDKFNNNKSGWSYIRCGAKNTTNGTAYVASTSAVPSAVGSVSIVIAPKAGSTSSNKVNSISLVTSTSSDFSNATTTAFEIPSTYSKDTQYTLTTSLEEPAANLFYKVLVSYTNGTKSAGTMELYNVKLYAPATTGPQDYASQFESSYNLLVNEIRELDFGDNCPEFSFTGGDEDVALISKNTTTGKYEISAIGAGSTTFSASWAADDNWNASTEPVSITVNVSKNTYVAPFEENYVIEVDQTQAYSLGASYPSNITFSSTDEEVDNDTEAVPLWPLSGYRMTRG